MQKSSKNNSRDRSGSLFIKKLVKSVVANLHAIPTYQSTFNYIIKLRFS